MAFSVAAMEGEKAMTCCPGIPYGFEITETSQPLGAFDDHIFNEMGDQAARQFVHRAAVVETGVTLGDVLQELSQKRHSVAFGEGEQPCPQAVVKVMGIVGDIVGEGRALRLGGCIAIEAEGAHSILLAEDAWQAAFGIGRHRRAIPVQQRDRYVSPALQASRK